jgi:RND family efflux transporter MFP subunit
MNPTSTEASEMDRQPAPVTGVRPKRYRYLGVGLGVTVLCLIGLAVHGTWSRTVATRTLEKGIEQATIMRVSITNPEQPKATTPLVLPGQTRAFTRAPIFAQTSGYLKKWYFDLGSRVKEGDILAEIDTPQVDQQLSEARAQLGVANAQLQLSQDTYNRFASLLKGHVISQLDFDNQAGDLAVKRSTVLADEATVRQLEALENFKIVRAPFDGIVTTRNTDIGALVTANSGNPLFTVDQTSPLRVYVSVPQNFVSEVYEGTEAELTFDNLPNRQFPAKVVHAAGAINPATQTQLTELQVPNSDGVLLPGAYTQVHLQINQYSHSLLIPANTLLFRAQGTQVGVVDANNKVVLRNVKIGRDLGSQLEIVEGLSPSDRVILNPSDSLAEGTEVQLLQSNPPNRKG